MSNMPSLDQAAKNALVLDLFRLGRLSRPDVGRMLGLDRFEVGAFLKRHQVFDDPTHEEIDVAVKRARASSENDNHDRRGR